MKRFLFVAGVALVVVAVAPPAMAQIVMEPGPSFGVDQPFPVSISGFDLVSAPAVPANAGEWIPSPQEILEHVCNPCPDPWAPSPQGHEQPPTCDGCYAFNHMAWEDHGNFENVAAYDVVGQASELIDGLSVHGALVRGEGKCGTVAAYDGDYMWRGSQVRYDESVVRVSSQMWGGTNDTWLQAAGWEFYDDGGEWRVDDGTLDMCKMF